MGAPACTDGVNYRCIECDSVYWSHAKRAEYCPECRHQIYLENMGLDQDPTRSNAGAKCWEVVKDPCEYPLKPGSKLGSEEIKYGLQYGGLVEGMLIAKKNLVYRVDHGRLKSVGNKEIIHC